MYVLLSITQDSCKAILALNIFRCVTTNFFRQAGPEGLLENLGMTMTGLTYVYAPDFHNAKKNRVTSLNFLIQNVKKKNSGLVINAINNRNPTIDSY